MKSFSQSPEQEAPKYNLDDTLSVRVTRTESCPNCELGYIKVPFEGRIRHEACMGTGSVLNPRPVILEGVVDAIILDKDGYSYRLHLLDYKTSSLTVREEEVCDEA